MQKFYTYVGFVAFWVILAAGVYHIVTFAIAGNLFQAAYGL
jgi:hypothetical protein